jgi:hypothetical protein
MVLVDDRSSCVPSLTGIRVHALVKWFLPFQIVLIKLPTKKTKDQS